MENGIIVKNETEYNYERYLKLNKFNMYSAKKVSFIAIIVSISIILLCSVLLLVLGDYNSSIMYFVLAVAFILIYICIPHIQTKKIYKSDNTLQSNIKNTFEFFSNEIKIENEKSSSTLLYEDLYKVYETKDMFYLYLNRIQVFIIAKDSFIIGDSKILEELLKNKLGKNYIKRI